MKPLLFFVLTLTLATLPDLTSAATLVPCSGTECSACNFAQMGNSVFKWLIGVLFVVFGFVAAMGGFGLVTSGGNPEAKSAAKQKLINAVVGILIMFAAWLLVDTILRGLVSGGEGKITSPNGSSRFWYSIECGTQTEATPAVAGTGFPPTEVGSPFYQFYAKDSVKNCQIPHSGSAPDVAACSAKQATDFSSVSGEKYVVEDCDPDIYPTTPPSWSTLPVCGTASGACTPLATMTDPLALQMEAGQTVLWAKTDPRLKSCAQKLGGSVQSAYRPPQYQAHLKEIHTKWCTQKLSSNNDPGCAAVKADVGAQFAKHGLNCNWPVAVNSNHTSGLAVDISGANPAKSAAACLKWYGSGDPVHYTLQPEGTNGCTCK
jgi:hypothetical protein